MSKRKWNKLNYLRELVRYGSESSEFYKYLGDFRFRRAGLLFLLLMLHVRRIGSLNGKWFKLGMLCQVLVTVHSIEKTIALFDINTTKLFSQDRRIRNSSPDSFGRCSRCARCVLPGAEWRTRLSEFLFTSTVHVAGNWASHKENRGNMGHFVSLRTKIVMNSETAKELRRIETLISFFPCELLT